MCYNTHMQTLKSVLFENPMAIYAGLGMIEIVLLALWHGYLTRRRLLVMAAPLLLGGIVFGVAHLVVTDTEKIVAALDKLADAVADGERGTAALETHLDDEAVIDLGVTMGGMGRNKAQALAIWRKLVAHHGLTRAAIHSPDVAIDGDKARTRFATILTYRTGDNAGAKTSLIWDVDWIRRGQTWRIIGVSPPSTGLKP